MALSLLSRLRGRPSIAAYLTLGLGGLTVLSVGSVLLLNVAANLRNTTELLQDKSRLLLGAMVARVESFLDPAERKAEFLALDLEEGRLSPADRDGIAARLRLMLGDASQITGMLFLDRDGTEVVALRRSGDEIETGIGSWRERRLSVSGMREAEELGTATAFWGPPVYSPAGPVVNLRRPVRKDGRFLGMIVAVIHIRDLSSYVAGLATEAGQNAFVLYDREHVLAHPAMVEPLPSQVPGRPLPPLDEVGDPVLAGIWGEAFGERLMAGDGHAGQIDGQDFVYLYSTVDGYSDAPLTVGSYFAEEDVGTQFQRVFRVLGAGIACLLLAVVAAMVFGRAIRRPIQDLAVAARAIQRLDLEHVPHLARSSFREIDDATRAVNAMTGTLKAFAMYVPRDLVRRLMARAEPSALRSESRDVAIMFTDIAGFTTLTERMGPEATAVLLNRHFDLVTGCIEAEGGTIDKFMGDGVMAHWGAVDDEPDHAGHALNAAGAIARRIREEPGEVPLRVRIGIHTGRVVVGNIGSHNRMNYTVIGDPVNAAARLQELGKTLKPSADVVILVTEETRLRGGDDLAFEPRGELALRGRDQPVAVYELTV